MAEDTWNTVGAPMLLDNNGTAVFIYTPPSLASRSASKATDPQHAAKMFKRAQTDTTGRWATFHFSSADNPYISKEALADFERRIAEHDEVMECYLMSGDSDYLIRVALPDIAALERFILEQLTPIPDIEKIRSSFALKQVRYKTALPLSAR
jgi:hypothetical protein